MPSWACGVVVKVSGYATHSVALGDPTQWWPWLHAKYAPFVTELVGRADLMGHSFLVCVPLGITGIPLDWLVNLLSF